MQPKNTAFRLSLIELVIQSDYEKLTPEQMLHRLGLYGYAEADLVEVIAEFDGLIARLRGHFADRDRARLGLA